MAETTESGSICSLAELKPEKGLICPFQIGAPWRSPHEDGLVGKAELWPLVCPHDCSSMAWRPRLLGCVSGIV